MIEDAFFRGNRLPGIRAKQVQHIPTSEVEKVNDQGKEMKHPLQFNPLSSVAMQVNSLKDDREAPNPVSNALFSSGVQIGPMFQEKC